MAPIAVGDTIPDGNLDFISRLGVCQTIPVHSIITGKKVFLLGVAGAYMPDSWWLHAPEVFRETYNTDSVQETLCICVNDPYVVRGWELSCFQKNTHFTFLADTTAAYVTSLGLDIDLTSTGFGVRSSRFGMVLEDKKVIEFREREPSSRSPPLSLLEKPRPIESRVRIAVGDNIPDGTLTFLNQQKQVESVSMYSIVTGKKVIILGVWGAFLPICWSLVRTFCAKAEELKSVGVHEILCISVNDPFVMRGWKCHFKDNENINFLADSTASYATSLGLAHTLREFGIRSKKFAMLLEDRRVQMVEVHRTGHHVHLADDMLAAMAGTTNRIELHRTRSNPINPYHFPLKYPPHPCELMGPFATAPLAAEDTIPDGNLSFVNEQGGFETLSIYSIISNKKALVIGFTGAFTPDCWWLSSPVYVHMRFNVRTDEETLFISVNDPYVVRGSKMACFPRNVPPHVKFLADSKATYVTSLGLGCDLTSQGLGVRSRRFYMLLEDRKVVRFEEFRKDWHPLLPIFERPTPNVSRAPIATGDIIPDGPLAFFSLQNNEIEAVSVHSIVTSKKVIVFGVRGAFLPGCSNHLVSSFIKKADVLKSMGVQEILCISVNDPFVMWGWKFTCFNEDGHIKFLADPTAAYVTSLGLEDDLSSDMEFGIRSRMFALFLENRRVKVVRKVVDTAERMIGAIVEDVECLMYLNSDRR